MLIDIIVAAIQIFNHIYALVTGIIGCLFLIMLGTMSLYGRGGLYSINWYWYVCVTCTKRTYSHNTVTGSGILIPIDGFRRTNTQSGEAHPWGQGRPRRTSVILLKCNCGPVRESSDCKPDRTRVPPRPARTLETPERYCSENESVNSQLRPILYVFVIF